jgi:hypothetical protein
MSDGDDRATDPDEAFVAVAPLLDESLNVVECERRPVGSGDETGD